MAAVHVGSLHATEVLVVIVVADARPIKEYSETADSEEDPLWCCSFSRSGFWCKSDVPQKRTAHVSLSLPGCR